MKTPDGWKEANDMLTREFTFGNFVETIEFVNKLVPVAEKAQHHPDIDIYGYKHVRVKFTTHDVGGKVTEKDYKLAGQVNEVIGK